MKKTNRHKGTKVQRKNKPQMAKKNNKNCLVIGMFPDQYKVVDPRLNKPVCHQQVKDGEITGSMLLQDLDTATVNKRREITYFCPNNIAMLLSINAKSIKQAKILYADYFENSSIELELNKVDLNKISSRVCDYIECIQSAIVFGYTALETFANLSIPEKYTYEIRNNSKGTTEIYDKKAIERWVSLRIKFQSILRQIYKTKKPESQKWWGHFSNLEKYRNDIIHQKSINTTNFYKTYFKKTIFSICESPVPIIRFFYHAHAENNRTNPIWPWLVNEENYFPITTQYDSRNFEVIGNMYDGIKK